MTNLETCYIFASTNKIKTNKKQKHHEKSNQKHQRKCNGNNINYNWSNWSCSIYLQYYYDKHNILNSNNQKNQFTNKQKQKHHEKKHYF